MGAIARQVLQVKRKNSTKCKLPDAMLTVLGSVASRSGPREVAMGSVVGARASVGAASTVGDSATGVALGATTAGGAAGCCPEGDGDSEVAATGAHEANRTANRLRVGTRRFFTSNPF